MTVLEYILNGLEAELAVERELGVGFVELESDRASVLGAKRKIAPVPPPAPGITPATTTTPALATTPAPATASSSSPTPFDFVFIHDRPLSPGGLEMMAKIVKALGKTPETAPVVLDRPFPRAKVHIVLGGLAMRKFFPDMKGVPGKWMRQKTGEDVLVTYSPEYILRFGEVTPAVRKMKEDMWRSLKAAMQRTRLYAR